MLPLTCFDGDVNSLVSLVSREPSFFAAYFFKESYMDYCRTFLEPYILNAYDVKCKAMCLSFVLVGGCAAANLL